MARPPSPEAQRQARFRERLKNRGLKTITLNVLPLYHPLLKALEKRMQRDNTPPSLLIAEIDSTMSTPLAQPMSAASAVAPTAAWTARPLFEALQPYLTRYGMAAELIDGAVLEVNHVDEGQPTEFWYAEVEYPTVEAARSWQPAAVGLADYLNDEVTDQPGQSMGAYWEQTRG